MPSMTDPMDALVSFQRALLDGEIELRSGELDTDLFVFADSAAGRPRISYVRRDRKTVKAFVNAILTEPIEGLPCFQLGVAVPVQYRNRGYAKSTLASAITELKHGLARNKIASFYVEGIVRADNEPSKRASAATISATPTPVTDKDSGLAAFQYLRKIE
jgi:hypothetical protein